MKTRPCSGCTEIFVRTGVLRSTDNGRTWFEVLSYSAQPWQSSDNPVRHRSYARRILAWRSMRSSWRSFGIQTRSISSPARTAEAPGRKGRLLAPDMTATITRCARPAGQGCSSSRAPTTQRRHRSCPKGWRAAWTMAPPGSRSGRRRAVAQVAISPNFDQDETLVGVLPYSGITNSNIIISHDAGETWRLGGDGLCPAYWFPQLTISPGFARDRTLLLASDLSSLFMSEDAGLTWRAIFPPGGPFCNTSTGYGLVYVAFSPDYPDDPTIYATTYPGPLCQLRRRPELDLAGQQFVQAT
jgi:hypothetical protein